MVNGRKPLCYATVIVSVLENEGNPRKRTVTLIHRKWHLMRIELLASGFLPPVTRGKKKKIVLTFLDRCCWDMTVLGRNGGFMGPLIWCFKFVLSKTPS